ncbi:MAG: ATP phosphoribosyltransferase regulatory subunit [Clostridia bacterium]|nr:ATP phosphoribosyltransferase regulatory subunit [Clostridia bacterium]
MQNKNVKLSKFESALFDMRMLFEQYGYSQYKVSKFESYDLYAKNKAFLVSDNVLTFTDTTGHLMALKPDVTLSIVKNTVGGNGLQKLYYSENVYRTRGGSQGFKEIMQTGLECIGEVDLYSTAEVLMLAAKSLKAVSEDYILDISHMGFISSLISENIPSEHTKELLELISQKNVAQVEMFLTETGVDADIKNALLTLTSLYMPLADALEKIKPLILNDAMGEAYDELKTLNSLMERYNIKSLYLDFSVINDMRYYNGIIFSGYIKGISDKVLSGGRYDNLLKRMKKDAGAIGFAFYLDTLEQLVNTSSGFGIDTLIVYDENVAPEVVVSAMEMAVSEGKTAKAVKKIDTDIKAKEIVDLRGEQ